MAKHNEENRKRALSSIGNHALIEYLSDDDVDEALDREIRGLLTTCFTRPQDVVFRDQRYFREPYRHRWVIRDERGAIVAHVGVHEKTVEAEGQVYRIGGIAEVCVHPDYRRRGYVRMMLRCVHDWMSERGFVFAVLFGEARIYASSGYVQVSNLVYGGGEGGWKPMANGMIREMSGTPWPRGEVRLPGPMF